MRLLSTIKTFKGENMTEKEKKKLKYLNAECASCKFYSYWEKICEKKGKKVEGWESACSRYKSFEPFGQ